MPPPRNVAVFVVDTTGGAQALLITDELRGAGISADRAYESRSMKSQMKAADRSGAHVAVIVGSDELAAGTAVVRPLRAERTPRPARRAPNRSPRVRPEGSPMTIAFPGHAGRYWPRLGRRLVARISDMVLP